VVTAAAAHGGGVRQEPVGLPPPAAQQGPGHRVQALLGAQPGTERLGHPRPEVSQHAGQLAAAPLVGTVAEPARVIRPPGLQGLAPQGALGTAYPLGPPRPGAPGAVRQRRGHLGLLYVIDHRVPYDQARVEVEGHGEPPVCGGARLAYTTSIRSTSLTR
jgi:hypothetical protein